MRFFTHRNDDRPARKLLPFARNKVLQVINGVNGGRRTIYTALRHRLTIRREDHAGLATNFAQQLRRDAAHFQTRMNHLVGFDQASELLRFIQHRIDMLRLGEILRLAAARHEAHFLAFGDFSITSAPASP